jgi:hypothetical protein
LVVCIMSTPIKMVNQSWTCLQLKHTFQVCYHQPSSWKLPSRPDMPLITCRKRLFVAFPMLFSMNSSWLVKSAYKKKWFGIINDVHHPYSCSEVNIWISKIDGPTVSLGGCILPTFIQMQLCDKICQES